MKLKLFFLILLSLLYMNAFAGNKKMKISGVVIDAAGTPVIHAIVLIDGKTTTTYTDDEGKYRIRVDGDATTIAILTESNGVMGELIDGRNKINFRFNSFVNKQPLAVGEEVVNTGYSKIKEKNLTSNIDRIDGSNRKYASYSSIYDMIQRECSGVRISNGSVVVQDSRNMLGPVPALYVVDGTYVNSIASIPPSSVESIQVLKGTSASIYGSRGFGGAIVITTKK
jgi:TonB-dependent SusC/RagA subfamily outer membrane receptor